MTPDVLRVSLPQTVSTGTLVRWMCEDSALAAEVLAVPRQRVASVAILSRLVDLSKLARSAKASEKERAIARKLIDTARPDLLESLRNATVGQQRMYHGPDALAVTVIERLKGRGYEKITMAPLALSGRINEFIRDEGGARARLIETYGPLCLWDVSGHENLSLMFSVLLGGTSYSSDLFWDTRSARTMANMFLYNAQFKGYIGTWDVSNTESMFGMFCWAEIEDSGIGSWNTKSLSNAQSMFKGAQGLSKDLDLSRWTFGPEPNLSSMFEGSGIVDCGIGNWDVSQANTRDMLKDANKFTGFASLKPPKWPTKPSDNDKVLKANVPDDRKRSFGAAAFGTPTSASSAQMTQEARIARILENLARSGRGSSSSADQPACAIL